MANNENVQTNSLFDKTVNIDPSGVIYNIRGTSIEDFVEQYLGKKNIDGVETVVLKTKREGNGSPEVVLYLFMNTNSKFIKSSASNVPANLRNKLDRVNIEVTEEFRSILIPLCGNKLEFGRRDNRLCYVKMDVFRVIGMMFAAEPSRHRIIITDVKKIPQDKDSILSVVKQIKYTGGNTNSGDNNRYARLVDEIEDKDRDRD